MTEGFVLGYHGCDIQVGERILAGKGHVRSSINEYDWLENGAYFWESSPMRALQWTQFLKNHPKIVASEMKEPFVIGATIKTGRCLHLTEAHCLGLVGEAYKELRATAEQLGIVLPTNQAGYFGDEDLVKRFLDCTIIEFLHTLQIAKQRPPFVRYEAHFLKAVSFIREREFLPKHIFSGMSVIQSKILLVISESPLLLRNRC